MNERFACEAVAQSHCVVCGGKFIFQIAAGRFPVCCSDDCNKQRVLSYSRKYNADGRYKEREKLKRLLKPKQFAHSCKQCQKPFRSHQNDASYCSKGCTAAHLSEIFTERAKAKWPACENCGVPFKPSHRSAKQRKAGSVARFCSRDCHSAIRAKAASTERERRCGCGTVLMERVRSCPRCKEIKIAAAKIRDSQRAKLRQQQLPPLPPLPPQRCKRCNKLFNPRRGKGKKNVFCNKDCGRSYHRGDNHRQRARRYGVAYEPVPTQAVLARDRYRCMVCGVKTPKRLRGSLAPTAPELDHRIPLAKGGSHTWDNLQCACRSCNLAKGGVRIRGQTVMEFLSVTVV